MTKSKFKPLFVMAVIVCAAVVVMELLHLVFSDRDFDVANFTGALLMLGGFGAYLFAIRSRAPRNG